MMEHSQIKTMQKFISSTTNNNNTHVILKNLVQIRTIQQIMLPSIIHKVQTQGLSVFQDETNDKKRKQIVGDQNDPGIAIISNILQKSRDIYRRNCIYHRYPFYIVLLTVCNKDYIAISILPIKIPRNHILY